jgi:transglutaminase/protease-like cytokinesis protein 3
VQYEYHYHLKAVEPNNVQSVREEELNLSYYKKSEPILFDADSAVNYYSITRNINPNDSSSSVSIKHLKTEPPSIPFPADSIGNYIDTISFSKVDSFVTAFSKQIDEKKLGYNLTKPWKKEIEKVRAIFMWMRQNIQYDYVGLANGKLTYLVSDIFKKRVAVCEGYANMFDYLCNQAGIKSYKLTGYVYPKQLHAWNTVCIDKKWYLVDVTWGMHYFLLEPALFLKDHYCTMRKWLLLTKPIKLIEWEEYAKKSYEKTTDDTNKNY